MRPVWSRLFKKQREIQDRLEKRTKSEGVTIHRYVHASREFQEEIERNHFFPYLVVEKGEQ